MKLMVRLREAVGADVRVDLRRADIGVAEHFLDGAEVGAAIVEVGGEAVPQHVGRHVLADVRGAVGRFVTLDSVRSRTRLS